jgi:hypothetical protein
MDLHSGEAIFFEGHPSWRGLLSFVVAAVDRAQGEAVERPAEPRRFVPRPGTTRSG